MIFFKRLLSLSIFALFSCAVPQTRSVQQMLDGTIWCGPLTKHPVSKGGFMAVYFLGDKAGLARGRTEKQAVYEVKKLALNSNSFTAYHPTDSRISIPNFWDDGIDHKDGLGPVKAEVIFTSNSSAKIGMYYSRDSDAPLIYEVSDARKCY